MLATALTVSSVLSSAMPAYAQEGWIKGWTGSAKSTNFSFNNETGKAVQLENTKINNGKFTDDEDTLIYYAKEIDGSFDFELKATVNIDSYNMGEEASNPNQGSVGIGVLDELYNKTDDKTDTNSVFLGTYAQKKSDKLSFRALTRSNSAVKTVSENALSDLIENTGENLGSFDLSIKKSGNSYILSCNGNKQTIEMNSFEGNVYPCLYISRNVKATFSNIDFSIEKRKITAIRVEGNYKNDFVYGEAFSIGDGKVIATYNDGTEEEIKDYVVKNFNSKSVGNQKVFISRGNAKAELNIKVSNASYNELIVEYPPAKTEYYLGTAFNKAGLSVKAVKADGTTKDLNDSQYTLYLDGKELKDGDILNKSGRKNISIINKEENGISGGTTTSITIDVKKDSLKALKLVKAPKKTAYYIGDEFNSTGMRVNAVYSDGSEELLKKSEYNISKLDSSKEGEKTIEISYKGSNIKTDYKVEVKQRQVVGYEITAYPKTTYAVGESFNKENMVVSKIYDNGDIEETNEYTIDEKSFSSKEIGKTSINIIPNDSKFSSISLPITISEKQNHIWRKAIFGQSASTEQEKEGNAGVKADKYGTVEGKINVKAWNATGKMTADHDGIVYYYTRVDAKNNFTLTADVTVKKYLEHNNDDTKRNGQEGFGLMARDVVPLLDKNDNMTTDYSTAKKDSSGAAVTQEKSSVFASNIAIAGGYSGTGWPTDTSAASYEKNSKLNRINLMARSGVDAVDGGGSKIGPYAISDSFPKEGNRYKITLQRVNGGMYAKCYDYSNGETKTSFIEDDNLLTVQNKNDIYVGFFAARWAEIDVDSVEFYESNRETDIQMKAEAKNEKTPLILIKSGKYSKAEDYKLSFEPTDSTGSATIRVNNRVVAQDIDVKAGINNIDLKLEKDKKNVITITYTPDDTLALTSYEDIISRIEVNNKTDFSTEKTIYASPNGSFDGDGTEAKPYDVDTATGFLEAGQTVELLGGTYKRDTPLEIELGNNGTADAPKTIKAKKGEKVIFDGQKQSALAIVTGSYWSIKDIEFINSGDNQKCFHLGGSNCVIENCIFRDNGDMGLQISRTYSTENRSLWPSNNLVLNCEAYNNCDPSMINADGFGAKLTVGEGNVFRNCSSHHNLDDGWDLYTKVNSGPIGIVTLENCVSYKNGFKLLPDGTDQPYNAGGNNGFKLGGENVAVRHILKNCIAYDNAANGVTTNSNPALALYDVISYNNGRANFRLYSDKPNEYNYIAENCTSFNCGADESDVLGTINKDNGYANHSGEQLIKENNYFITEINGNSYNSRKEMLSLVKLKEKVKAVEGSVGVKK